MKKNILFIIAFVIIVCMIIVYKGFIDNKITKLESDSKVIETQNNENVEKYAEINPEDILFTESKIFDIEFDISDIKTLAENSDFIAIVKVNSAEGSNYYFNSNNGEQRSISIYTEGDMTIKKVLKSNLNKSIEKINYSREDGALKFKEYLLGQPESHNEKMITLLKKEKGLSLEEMYEKYVISKTIDNVSIEKEKEYLIFAVYHEEFDKYEIIGFQHGLREYNNGMVLNNDTGEYELLEDIENNIK